MSSQHTTFHKVPELAELRSAFPGVKALFFDMDGTLFNTESYHADALLLMAAKYQIRPPYSAEIVHEMMMGKADHLVFEIIRNWEGVPETWSAVDFINEKNANVISLLEKIHPSEYFPSATLSLLEEARREGMFLALVTSSEKAVTDELLRIAEVRNYFNFILTRDDTERVKPDPWPYLKALEVSGVQRKEALIFEDSHVGLTAAVASGAHVIKVSWF